MKVLFDDSAYIYIYIYIKDSADNCVFYIEDMELIIMKW